MEKPNAFKSLESQASLPPDAKQETLGSLYALKLVFDLVDLFVAKAGGVATAAISLTPPQDPPASQES
ncbi:MAG: hypothetical protein D6722_11855 [Bacteroidetes bacterium]|nr:MAG: hypothetical protein D6722_11855 [Bacteroidota bacterium]